MTRRKKIALFSVLGVLGAYILFSLIIIIILNQDIKELPNQISNQNEGAGDLILRTFATGIAEGLFSLVDFVIYFFLGFIFLVLILVGGIILLVVFRKKNKNSGEIKPIPIK